MLQQPPQGMPMQQMSQQPQPPSPSQIQDAHAHFSYMQKMLDSLIKLPDSKLNLEAIFDAAADMVHENRLSAGKKGVSAQEVAAEMSSPNFPSKDTSPQQIRQFLQNYFDKSVQAQAMVTNKFGPPQQTQMQE